jgi:glycosyltransferase involved in cell wall biosynthesis/SAM-dependent methyltransferase
MRISFHSPLPPAASGIADYSAALVAELAKIAQVTINGDPREAEVAVYQIGNNADHVAAYEMAVRHPGVVVLHEANLHHLLTDLTIRRNDWDGYLRELEYERGAAALAYGRRVRALEVGPDYDGVPMLRRLLQSAKGLIVHSRYVEVKAREAGFQGPIGVVPHGAWLPDPDGRGWRAQLGVVGRDPLIGIFGHLKPYKRIAEALRAFAQLYREVPAAKMILVGEPHPEIGLDSMLATLGLKRAVRCLGACDDERFNGYLKACDIVLNLRYPTVGETSGTLLRALGLGKAVVVSDVGAFAEFPADVCLHVPVNESEEATLLEYLRLLVSREDLRFALGKRAREWVSQECSWPRAADLYAKFLERFVAAPPKVSAEYLETWCPAEGLPYLRTHMERLVKTLAVTPAGGPGSSVLEMGVYMQITPALQTKLGYGYVRGCYFGPAGVIEQRSAESSMGERFSCEVDLFNAECDRFPYDDASFDTVICGELVEHLPTDPMFLMSEINRILKPGGHLLLTTPNAASLRAIDAVLHSYHPAFFNTYLRPRQSGENEEARHAREYTAKEAYQLLVDAGFEIELLETGDFARDGIEAHRWVERMLAEQKMETVLRGDGTYVVGRKAGPVRERYPAWLYS